jgi:hypothetical protein
MGKHVTLKFRWTSFSPDPHNVTMRNTLEPEDVFVEVRVPKSVKYFNEEMGVHRELEIQAELSPDIESPGEEPEPVLSVEGMKFVVDILSLEDSSFEPEVEDDDEDWGDDNTDEDDFGDDFEDDDTVASDDDEDFEDDNEEW